MKTTGVNQDPFSEKVDRWPGWEDWQNTDLKIQWTVVDVGGQRSERRKWVGFFDNVQTIVFLVNLLGYNKVLYEDENLLRMHESMELFETMFGEKGNAVFAKIPVTVAFNKLDSFKEQYTVDGMKRCFPGIDDANCKDADAALEHIKKVFVDKSSHRPTPIRTVAFNAIVRSECEDFLRGVQTSIMDGEHGKWMKGQVDGPDPSIKKALDLVKKGAICDYSKFVF